LVSTAVIGLILRKQAQKSKSNYLLGGNKLPWYLLGLSNASGMFDISGTMWLVTLMFVYGFKSVWIPWLWPVFNQIFMAVYVSKWLRRSNATTGAEWIRTRFGDGKGSKMSHSIVVIFALLSCLGFLAYGFIGLGKFIEIFIPWEFVSQIVPFDVPAKYVPHMYGIAFTIFAVFYAVLGGMSGIVWADLLQYIIMTFSSILIGVIAIKAMATHVLNVPEGWFNPFFGWTLDIDWSGIITEVNEKIASDGYSLFTIFFMLMILKGIFASDAGPPPNYDMQKILATKSPKDASKMSGFVSVVLMPVRYIMIAGFAVLGILFYDKLDLTVAGRLDFEQILPSAIFEFVPVGFMGLLLAGLLAAFMSTFAGTLNAAQAYIVNDLYLRYIKPKASNKEIKVTNYVTGVLVVVISIVMGFFTKDVNSILQWIVSALLGSYVASNSIRWHWWRFNGHGYFWGMVAGLIPAMIFPVVFNETLDLYYFPLLFGISILGCIIGTLAYPPTEEETLKKFYKSVRPWGFWKPIHDKVKAEDPAWETDANFKRDAFNIVIGIIVQTLLVLLPMYLVTLQTMPMIICAVGVFILGYILKRTWWDTLTD
jgi:Na+/proline symporter